MQQVYFGTIFTATIIFFLIGLLLFLQRKKGERSRTILAGMTFLSVFNYIGLIIYFHKDPNYNSESILDMPFLLTGIFVITIYLIYPIEVISPGWLNWKRLLKMYIPAMGLLLFYRLTLWLGVEYTQYQTLEMMIYDIFSFQVIFRIVLALLLFTPAALLYYIPYTRQYSNTDYKWIRGYNSAVIINMAAYLMVNVYDTFFSCSLYVAVSVSCSLYIAYNELYVRLIGTPSTGVPSTTNKKQIDPPKNREYRARVKPNLGIANNTDSTKISLFYKLEDHINTTQAWCDPDLSTIKLAKTLQTTRTLLRETIMERGYSSFNSYLNEKRIEAFIRTIDQQGRGFGYLQTFFDVGFRSKSAALRNFKEFTGKTLSDYFQKEHKVGS